MSMKTSSEWLLWSKMACLGHKIRIMIENIFLILEFVLFCNLKSHMSPNQNFDRDFYDEKLQF